MSKTFPAVVPAPAKLLLDFIGNIEAPLGYDTIFGNNQDKLPKPLTTMTMMEIIAAQVSWTKRFGSSAAGRYQFMRATLQGLRKEYTSVPGGHHFTADLQDRLGFCLLLRRGYENFVTGHLSLPAFALALAQEWASLPVLSPMQGAHRAVVRGQSYYAGDGVNKSLVDPGRLNEVLMQVLSAYTLDADKASPRAPSPMVSVPSPHMPEEIRAEKLDKRVAKTKTFWMWITTALGAPLATFGGMDWRVQLAILLVIGGFAVYAIKRRADLGKIVRAIGSDE